MRYLSHDFWKPEQTVTLSPFAALRDQGECYTGVKSAVRVLDILEHLTTAARPLRAVEIAASLSLSPSSANQLLKTMVDSAYLIFDPVSKRYCPSPRVARLGADVADDYFGSGVLEALMTAVHRAVGKPVTLSTSQGAFMQLFETIKAGPDIYKQTFFRAHRGVASRVPLFGSSIGGAWLSTQDDKAITAAIRLCRRELGTEANDIDAILERIERIRKQGYSFGGISADDGIRALAVPLPPARNGVVLVIGTSGVKAEMEAHREDIFRIVREKIRHYAVHEPVRERAAHESSCDH